MRRGNILSRLLSEKAGYDVSTPRGASLLCSDIESVTGERLSVNTIKRLTGVLPYEGEARMATLEILSRYLNYPSGSVLYSVLTSDVSDFTLPEGLVDAADLPVDSRLHLEWAPGRIVEIRHLGEGIYVVEKAVNSKLKEADVLKIGYIGAGYPLFIKEVRRGGESLGEYTAAYDTGLTAVEFM